jgi:endonuclease/exonuclease/phosphatase family metal-dependent hydrolase
MLKRALFLAAFLAGAIGVGGARAESPGHDLDEDRGLGEKRVTVMTRNLYFGADLRPAIVAILSGDPNSLPPVVSEIWAKVQATDFPTRVEALAAEIQETRPDLIGLQEAVIWRSEFPSNFAGPDAAHLEYDFVSLLLDALEARGEHYSLVASAPGFDVEAPRIASLDPLEFEDIRLTERSVILARENRARPRLKLSNSMVGEFETNVAFDGVTVLYGWASVDVKFRGEEFRFVTTHLEADVEIVRQIQGAELLAGPLDTDLPVILAGDLNSNANGGPTATTYFNFLAAGFTDAWGLANPGEVIDTCCHDELLVSPTPFAEPFGRIDHILFRGEFRVGETRIVGGDPAERIDGLWPSDHAGVVVSLGLRDGAKDLEKEKSD